KCRLPVVQACVPGVRIGLNPVNRFRQYRRNGQEKRRNQSANHSLRHERCNHLPRSKMKHSNASPQGQEARPAPNRRRCSRADALWMACYRVWFGCWCTRAYDRSYWRRRAMFRSSFVMFGIFAAFVACTSALADISISKQPTQNMSCSDGLCTPTAPKAVLNVHDLTTMLASGDLTVQSGNGNQTAAGIDVVNSFSWTNASRLTLSAKHNIVVKAPVTVAGTGALSLTYGAGNPDSDL